MKSSAFMLAFVASTAIHVGALMSDILNVNAQNSPANRVQSVRINIVSSEYRAALTALHDVVKKETPRREPRNSMAPKQPVPVPDAVLVAKAGEFKAIDKEILPKTMPDVVTRLQNPADAPSEDPSYEDVPSTMMEAFPVQSSGSMPGYDQAEPCGGAQSGEKACDGEPAVRSAMSLSPKRESMGSPVIEESGAAVITGLSRPEYPRLSRIRGEEGSTVLSLEIHADGKLGDVEVVQSSGYQRLDKAAIKAIQKAGFIPAQKDGRTISSKKRIAFRFELEEEE